MVEFKLVISDGPKSYAFTAQESQAAGFLGKRIGESVDGEMLGLGGYTFKLMGGTDRNGFPMRGELTGARQQRILTAESTGYHPSRAGTRDRRTFRGNTISEDIVQINLVVTSKGQKPLDQIVPQEKDAKAK
jgi:small subunit ribosomal protein S6e